MKKIKLIPVEIEDEFDSCEDMACGILFMTRFVQKHVFHKNLYS